MTQQEIKAVEKPILIERYADNGAHSHWELIDSDGVVIWSEDSELRKPCEPDNELLEALKGMASKFDYKKQSIYSFAKTEIDAAIKAISSYEKTDQMTYFDNLRKPCEPETKVRTNHDKELLEALKKICKVAPSYIKNPDDELDNAICDAMLAVYDYEQTDQMTYSEYVRKDLALEFAIRFYQLMTSARVDEYIGARKNVCVNDLFEEYLKTKED